MQDLQVAPSPPRARRRRRWRWLLPVVAVLLVVGGYVVWRVFRPPRPVSVSHVVDQFRRQSQPAAPAGVGGPAPGVYVYATSGSEHISVGGITHRYPARTTVTVTRTACGLRIRWDALSGRWARWDVCATPQGWRLQHYTDVHTFLYMNDVHDYRCATVPADVAGDWTVTCTTRNGVLVSTVHRVGVERRRLDGSLVRTTRVRIDQQATGGSTSSGVVDVWVLGSGLPVHLEISDHGSQTVLGQRVSYDESASFDLTTATPRR